MKEITLINNHVSERINRFFHPEAKEAYTQQNVHQAIIKGLGYELNKSYTFEQGMEAGNAYLWFEKTHILWGMLEENIIWHIQFLYQKPLTANVQPHRCLYCGIQVKNNAVTQKNEPVLTDEIGEW